MPALPGSPDRPSFRETQIVWLAGIAMGVGLLSSMNALQGKWFMALMAVMLFWGVAVLTGKVERFLFGFIFFVIPLNADFQLFGQVTSWRGIPLPPGTPQLGLSAMDLALMVLYPLWIGRLLTHQRRTVLWPAGGTLALLLIAWGAISMLNSISTELSSYLLFNYLKAFLLFFYVANHVRTREDFLFAARCMLAGMVVESLITCAQYFNGANLGLEALGERKELKELTMVSGVRFRPGGTLGHPNSLGGYLAAALPVALALHLAPGRRGTGGSLWMLVSVGLGALALIISMSRSAWLSAGLACIGLVIWTAMQKKEKFRWQPVITLLGLSAVAAIAFAPLVAARWNEDDRGSTYSRVPQTQMGMAMIAAHPFLGVGLNNYGVTSHRYETYVVVPTERTRVFEHVSRIHNIFLQLATETGLVGLALCLAFIGVVIRKGMQRIRRIPDDRTRWILAAVLLGLISRILHDAVHTGDVAQIPQFWMYAGLLGAGSWMLTSKRKHSPPPAPAPAVPR